MSTASTDRKFLEWQGPSVYAMQCMWSARVKIGISSQVQKRLCALNSTCPTPIRLLAVVGMSNIGEARTRERAIHAKLKADRLRGEWFRPSDAVRNEVAYLELFMLIDLEEYDDEHP